MPSVTYKSKLVLKEKIIDGYLTVSDGTIAYVGEDRPSAEYVEIKNGYIAPGFIDIHCHTANSMLAGEDPIAAANFHLNHGTTTLLLSYYRDIPHRELIECLNKTKEAMKVCKNLYGAHLEGPYLNANLGFGQGTNDSPDKEKYDEYIKTGIVRHWTSAPEIKGVPEFIGDIASHGIIPAIGHSGATYDEVKAAYDNGARIVTHIFDATKAPESKYVGTLEVDFNEACMLMDDMYYEVICDSLWIHVRKAKFELLLKTVGVDRIVAITDMSASPSEDGLDVNIVDGLLSGTSLTQDRVALNLYNAGYCLPDVFKMTSLNPAKALRLSDRGEIAVGKRADLIVIDENAKLVKVL